MSEGPILPGKSDSHACALDVPEAPLSPFATGPPLAVPSPDTGPPVSEAEGRPPL